MLRLATLLLLSIGACTRTTVVAPPVDPFVALEQLQGRWSGRLDSGIDSITIIVDRVIGTEVVGHIFAENDTWGIFVSEDVVATATAIDDEHAEMDTGNGPGWSAWCQIVWDRAEPQRLLFFGPDNGILLRDD